ncbi:hypothetical protein BGX27_002377, partial [Mortierella sp. AM989]
MTKHLGLPQNPSNQEKEPQKTLSSLPPKRTGTGVEDVDEEVTVEKVKECPRANPPMWTRVDVEEVSEDVPAEEED